MSRVYFHTRNGKDGELLGSERAHLDFVTRGPALNAWDLDRVGRTDLTQATRIMDMIPEVPDDEYGANYLHTNFRAALKEDEDIRAYYAYHYSSDNNVRNVGPVPRMGKQQVIDQFIGSLKMRLVGVMADTKFRVGGHDIEAWQLGMNTAMAMGSDVVKLAAKIHAKCEVHGYIEGEDRSDIAEIMEEGLRIGIYRSDAGWEQVIELLRSNDTEPVVMSYSVCDQFPNQHITDWMPPADQRPENVTEERWAEADEDTRRDWQYDCWYEMLDDGARWDIATEALRRKRPYNRLTYENLGDLFYPGLTIYDLLAPDRDERVAAAFASQG